MVERMNDRPLPRPTILMSPRRLPQPVSVSLLVLVLLQFGIVLSLPPRRIPF